MLPVFLSEQPSGGRTVMEKLEACSDVGFAIIILTPDDLGGYVEARAGSGKLQHCTIEPKTHFMLEIS